MERIKSLLAVVLFVAGLIFGTPIINPRVDLNKQSTPERIAREKSLTDTILNSQYILQPVTKIDLAKAEE
jgi:hypothetical protein